MRADLRSDLLACMTADPESLLGILEGCMSDVPGLEEVLERRVHARLSTHLPPGGTTATPVASAELLAALRARGTVLIAAVAVPHPPVLLHGHSMDLSVAAGGEAIVLGGNLVDAARVAAWWGVLERDGTPRDQAWDLLGSAICGQCSGPVARRSVTHAGAVGGGAMPGHARELPPVAAMVQEPEQPARACLHLIAADWAGAARIRRQRHETDGGYLARVLEALRVACASGEPGSAIAQAQVQARYPQYARTVSGGTSAPCAP